MADAFNQIFDKNLTEKLYETNAFLNYFSDYSDAINGLYVNIPAFIFAGTIAVNGSNFSDFSASRPQETSVNFKIDEYSFDKPIHVTDFDEVIHNYKKFDATFLDSIRTLTDTTSKTILNKLALEVVSGNVIRTSGAAGTNNNPLKGASRKKLSYADIVALAQMMDEDNLPSEGRYLILTPTMYYELLTDTQIINALNFGNAVLPTGVVREVAGINIMVKNTVSTATTGAVVKTLGSSIIATDNLCGFAFHTSCVIKAQSGINTYTTIGDPYKRGNVMNFSMYLGCKNPRIGSSLDNVGTYLIIQAA